MSASAFLITVASSTAVNFLPTFMEAYQQIFIRTPAEQYDWEAYSLPLKWDAWLVVIAYCFVLPFIMVIIMSGSKNTISFT